MTPYFHDLFDSVQSIRDAFEAPEAIPDGAQVIAASYSYEDYSGDASVYYLHDGVIYEAYGSHCSCYGLEGQWRPEQAQPQELRARMATGTSALARHVVRAIDAIMARGDA